MPSYAIRSTLYLGFAVEKNQLTIGPVFPCGYSGYGGVPSRISLQQTSYSIRKVREAMNSLMSQTSLLG